MQYGYCMFPATLHSCCRNSESLNPRCTRGLVLHSSQFPARHSPKKHAGPTAVLPLSAAASDSECRGLGLGSRAGALGRRPPFAEEG